jgi:hypothetical protein
VGIEWALIRLATNRPTSPEMDAAPFVRSHSIIPGYHQYHDQKRHSFVGRTTAKQTNRQLPLRNEIQAPNDNNNK